MGRVVPIEDASMLAEFAYQIQNRHPDELYAKVMGRIRDSALKPVVDALRDKALDADLSHYAPAVLARAEHYWSWAQTTAVEARRAGQARDLRRRSGIEDLV